ncbi:MAG TPA: hypothetical protein VE869_06305 [Gemmatimonas sp.]|nr:hypothetical protein [Gemmatimonas sp.]
MAEIKIEEKKRNNLLPLILAAVLVLALLGWCATRNNDDGTATAGADTTSATRDSSGATGVGTTTGASGAVADFNAYVTARDTTQETEENHQYTAGGVRRLAAALESVAGGNPNIGVYADSMRSSMDRLQQTSGPDRHSDDAKAAFSAAVSAMEQIDRARGRTRDVAPMRAMYNELDSQQTLIPQLPVVQRFFEAARDALGAMGAG